MKNKSCKFVIVAAAVMLLAGCNTAQAEQPPVMQGGTIATTSMVTTVPSVNVTSAPTAVTTVPTEQPTAPTIPAEPTGTTVPSMEATTGSTTVSTAITTTKPTTVQTTVTTTACQHRYGEWYTASEATCVANRKEARKCERCGTEQPRTVAGSKDPNAHNWEMIYDDPTDYYGAGWTAYKCTRCKDENIVDKEPWTQEQKDAFCREIEALIVEQLNAYRIAEGTAPATHLPGMQQVAIYRAWQVKDKELAHDWDQLIEACTVYKYGLPGYEVTVDEVTGAYIQGGFDGTYCINGTEALDRVSGMFGNTAEELSRVIASGLYESKDHWRYLGAEKFPYMAAGITFEPMVGWSCCVLVSYDNHDLQINA